MASNDDLSAAAIKTEEVEIESTLPVVEEEDSNLAPETPLASAKMFTCGNVRTLKCYLCPTNPLLPTPDSLQQHLLDEHNPTIPDDLFKCSECSVEVRTLTAFNQHLSRHDAILRPFVCSICPVRFRRNQKRRDHESLVHGIDNGGAKKIVTLRPPYCNLCCSSFAHTNEIIPHFQQAHPDRSLDLFPCGHCEAAFFEYEKLKIHRQIHTDKNSCDQCEKRFVESKDLAYHKFKVHGVRTDGKEYVTCPVCNKEYMYGSRYNRHLKSHDDAKPFACEFCDKAFRNHRDLENHLICHGDGVSIPCDQCDKLFRRKASLVKHIKICHLEKVIVQCERCGKKLSRKPSILLHQQNCGKKPARLACNGCDKTFASRSALRRHKCNCAPESRS